VTVETRCEREDCGRYFEADGGDGAVRCPYCGHNQASAASEGTPVGDGGTDDTAAESGETTLSVDAGSTVTVTITVEVDDA
jgi:hypothetical protein